ncbi:PREDICTED: uncharacterized protein LOC109179764 [Ipomoea nil]|uniref:uncharacterized protein LOC109179764 n=1 Tax=Ipomoea nil TaxID=35883 RepID=UPI000900BD98|nr:PREDICTED: uncharacterized protein LOC109179764 [Ipomoea nil]
MSSTGTEETSTNVENATSTNVENAISRLVFVPNLSGNPVITSEKLCGSQNYHSWSDAVEMWFMGQGVIDHLEHGVETEVPENEKAIWKRVDAQLFVDNLVNLKKDGMSMEAFLGKTQSLLTEFNKLLPVGGTPDEQIAQREKFFVVLVLTKLGPEFENTRNQILGDKGVPGVQELFKRLLQVASFPGETSASTTEQSALVIQGSRGYNLGNRNKDRSGQKNARYCDYCNRSGHTRDRCWKLHGKPLPAPTNVAQLKLEESGSKNVSLAEYEEFARFKANAQATVFTPLAHTGETHAALVSQSGPLGPRVLDSGASEQICGNSSLLTHLTNSKSLPSIVFGNGSICSAKGVGKARPLPDLPLSSVLHIPTCPFNLISIRQLTRSLDCLVTFSPDSVVIQDRRSGKTIGSGYESKGLYRLSTPAFAVCSATISPSLTHCRLGHPSLKKLQQLEPSLSKLSSLECESCQFGKHSRTSFPERKFQNEIKNQFGVSIKILRSDNAREYFNTPLSTLLDSEGILYESSCPDTPQQNGVFERKNRHLVETARTMLLHYKVPSYFWGDAILHSCYLINRMPSSVLHGKIPYNILFPQEPLHKLPLRVFGCTCFVRDITPGRDKLSPKSLKCIFVGYSRVQKGFRCYCPETQRFYVSPNVTFFEYTPFFSSDSIRVVDPFPDVLPVPSFEGGTEIPISPVVLPPNPSQTHTVSPFYLSSVSVPNSVREALSHPGWQQAMVDEMVALQSSGTWDLVPLPPGKTVVGCHWVYNVKVGPDGQIDRLKAGLVAKGYTQSPRAWFGRFSTVLQEFGLVQSKVDHSVFYRHRHGKSVYLVVYVDDIVITGDDAEGILQLKQHLFQHFETKGLGKLKYFLGIEVAQSKQGICISQRKYALDILKETGMSDCRPIDTPMDPNIKLVPEQGKPFSNPGRYRRLVGKLLYLTVTRPDISFAVSVVSQFFASPCDSHWEAVIRILRYIKKSPGNGVLYKDRGNIELLVILMQIGLGVLGIESQHQGTAFFLVAI